MPWQYMDSKLNIQKMSLHLEIPTLTGLNHFGHMLNGDLLGSTESNVHSIVDIC